MIFYAVVRFYLATHNLTISSLNLNGYNFNATQRGLAKELNRE